MVVPVVIPLSRVRKCVKVHHTITYNSEILAYGLYVERGNLFKLSSHLGCL